VWSFLYFLLLLGARIYYLWSISLIYHNPSYSADENESLFLGCERGEVVIHINKSLGLGRFWIRECLILMGHLRLIVITKI